MRGLEGVTKARVVGCIVGEVHKLTFDRFDELIRNFPHMFKWIWMVSILFLQEKQVKERHHHLRTAQMSHATTPLH